MHAGAPPPSRASALLRAAYRPCRSALARDSASRLEHGPGAARFRQRMAARSAALGRACPAAIGVGAQAQHAGFGRVQHHRVGVGERAGEGGRAVAAEHAGDADRGQALAVEHDAAVAVAG